MPRASTLGVSRRGKKWTSNPYINGDYEWQGTFDTMKDAQEASLAAMNELRRLPKHQETCGSFAARWIRDYPRPKQSTNTIYHDSAQRFAQDFGTVRLRDVDKPAARAWAMSNAHRLGAVRAMFGDAVRDGLILNNPFAALRLPRSRGRKDLVVLSEAELSELADLALAEHDTYGSTFRAVILFAGYVGLRPAELYGLEWDDIDFGAGEIQIRRQLHKRQMTKPKNGRTRKIILPPPAADALRSMPRRADSEIVFPNKSGNRLSQPTLWGYWTPVRSAFGRPGMDFYELRHACATYLLNRGASPADVAVQLGHTDGGALVMSTYGHPSDSDARERLRKLFEAPTPLRAVEGESEAANG